MVVGEAPGRQEAETGKPFQGKAGQLLRQLLNDVEIDPEEVYISNHVKCRPPENRTPTTTELKACRPYLDTEIETVNPKFVLLLGATAAKLINKTKIASSHGRPFEKNGRTYFVTYHPAAALRDPSRLPTLKSDLRQFSNLVKGITARDDFRWAAVTKRNLNQFLAEFQAARSFAFDLETSQLDPMLPGAAIRCMGIALPTGMNWVIPLTSERSDFEVHEAQQEVMELLVRLSKGKICVGHHGKFDNKWLKAEYGVSFNRTDDTIMLAHLIDENQPINLEYQSQLHLGAPAYDIPLKEKTQWEYSERRLEYCARDVYYTLQLRGVLLEKVRKESHTLDLYRKLMMPISRVFEDIELRGLYIDIEQKEITRKELQKQMNKTLLQLNKMAGERINWNSSAQVGRLLFGKLGLPVLAKTDKGQPSTAEAVLKELDHPIMDLLMKYRELGKQLSTYVEGWDSFMVGPHLYLSTNLNGTVCFTEDTLVDTSRGVLPFPQVKVGDRVLTHTGHWQPVLEKVVNGTKEVFRVTLTNGLVLDTTGNHPYLTPAGWVEADQLKPGTLVTSYGAPEIWRPIRGWEDLYEVSSWGRVRHLPSGITRGKYRIIKSRVRAREGTGRPVITLNRGSSANRKDGTAKDFYVHRLVAHHFIDNPRSLSEVRHLDGRVWNNRVENLAWGTCSDNRRGERYKYTETTNEWKYPFELSAVQSVTRLGKQFTYGLVVAEDHSHVTNGILTHNTGRFSSRLHQVPRDPLIRSLFIAPPGWVMVVADFCLTGDTEITTIEGYKTIKEVIERKIPVLSFNRENLNKIKGTGNRKLPALEFKDTLAGGLVGVQETVKVTLDDGTFVVCTPEHKWLNRKFEFVETKNLRVGDRLSHVYTTHTGVNRQYPNWSFRGFQRPCADVVAEFSIGEKPAGYHTDHIDADTKNYYPSNLRYLPANENQSQGGKRYWKQVRAGDRSDALRKERQRKSANQRDYFGEANPHYGQKLGSYSACKLCGTQVYTHPGKKNPRQFCCAQHYYVWKSQNHRVISIEPYGKQPVYQITVADNHNYVLKNGLISANSQQELRIAAHLSQDPAMLLVFQTGGDIHSQTAREVLGNPDPTKEQRKAAKAVNFGFIYGMWWKKFKKYAKEKYGIILTDAESEQYRAAFFRRYNRLLAWHKKQRALVKADGKVINLAGRTRHLPGVWSTDREIQQEAERQAINTVVQGFGGDMKVMSMIEIDATFDETVLQLLGEVHDSVLMWVKEEHLEETLPEVKRIMEHPALMDELGIHLSVPVVVDIEVGPWGKGKAWTPPGLQGS